MSGDDENTERNPRDLRSRPDRDRAAESDDAAADIRDRAARSDDEAADDRDRQADARDASALARDRDDQPSGRDADAASDRRAAREDAAHDRASAVEDRGRARRDRDTARQDRERAARDRAAATEAVGNLRALLARAEDNPDDMLLIGQAQGRLMDERGLDMDDALLELCTQARHDRVELRVAAERVVTSLG